MASKPKQAQGASSGTPQPQTDRCLETLKAFLQTPPKDRQPDVLATIPGLNFAMLSEAANAILHECQRDDMMRLFYLRVNTTFVLSQINLAPHLRTNYMHVQPVFARIGGPQGIWGFGVKQRYNPNPRSIYFCAPSR